MAYKVTLRQLMTRARQRANDNTIQFVTDAELTDMISQSYAEFYDLVRGSTFGGQYYRSSKNITMVAGTASYALPDDFCSVISVDCFITGTGDVGSMTRSAMRFQEEQRNMFRSWPTGGWDQLTPIFYDLQGSNIAFIPAPQAAHIVGLNYVPTAAVLVSADGDSIDSINGWDEWIVLDVAIKLCQKSNKAERIGQLMPYLQRQEARIAAAAPQRDLLGTERVHEVAPDYGDYDY